MHIFIRLASLGGGPQAHVHMEGKKCRVLYLNLLGTIYALRISARSALRSYVKGASPAPLESVFDRLSTPASGLGIGHTRTKI